LHKGRKEARLHGLGNPDPCITHNDLDWNDIFDRRLSQVVWLMVCPLYLHDHFTLFGKLNCITH